jgi:hypothetical protein
VTWWLLPKASQNCRARWPRVLMRMSLDSEGELRGDAAPQMCHSLGLGGGREDDS